MPPPREQPNPPGRKGRRPEAPMPGSWLWLVVLLLLVLVLFVTVGVGSGPAIAISDLYALAEQGKKLAEEDAKKNPDRKREGKLENKIIKKVWFVGQERLEGELQDNA